MPYFQWCGSDRCLPRDMDVIDGLTQLGLSEILRPVSYSDCLELVQLLWTVSNMSDVDW